ncbi:right-handed parallel beta-helix repeat-containing protein [Jiangella asiatica]|uniref:BIG2 domain-containing protein n=1 Tax=Jiangella asiatica TaxID=2530372 RepID=A0A4V2Z331_9ACTN|nr:right-handed parallel beta-helix repeat-containing protein [Jiangella asiatica]TDE11148.1 hypothetical protein E1269_09750 [Jiangella asiatica]
MSRLTTTLLAGIAITLASMHVPADAAVTDPSRQEAGAPREPAYTFYVSPDGDDRDAGSVTRPLRTLAGARDAVSEFKQRHPKGDITVYLRGGRYQLDQTVVFGPEDSGNAEQTITYAAYPGERPVFSSGELIDGWRPVADPPAGLSAAAAEHVWVADVPTGWLFKTLFDGERMVPRAKGPAFAPTVRIPVGQAPESSYWQLPYPEGAMKNWPNVTDVEIEIIPTVTWMRNILPLASVDEEKNVATMQVPGRYPLGQVWNTSESVWVENVVDVLDEPGEWAVNSHTGKVYYWPVSGTPGEVRAPRLTELVLVEGDIDYDGPADTPVTDLAFRGLTFTQGERDTYPAGYRGYEMQHAWDLQDRGNALVRLRGVEDSVVESSEFYNTGHNAIRCDLHCRHNTFSDNLVHHVGASGIILAGYGAGTKDVNRDNVVENNHIHHVGLLYPHGMGLWAWQSGHNRLAHNLIHDTPYTGLTVSGRISFARDRPIAEATATVRWDEIEAVTDAPDEGWTVGDYDSYEPFLYGRDNVVEYNDISTVMTTLHDGNAIYVTGQARGNVVRRNYLHDIESPNQGYALRADDAQFGTLFTENVIDTLAHMGGIVLKGQNDIVNNIVAGLGQPEAYLAVALGPVAGSRLRHNVYFSTESGQNILREGPSYRGPEPHLTETVSEFNTYYSTADPNWGPDFVDGYRQLGYELTSLTTDPRFYDADEGDFRMRPGSLTAAMGFDQIDMSRMGLTAAYPFRESDELDRLFVRTGDQFASVRMRDRERAVLRVSGRTRTGYVADLTDTTLAFTSSDPTVATVDDRGVVTAVADGTAEVTVTATTDGVQKTSIAVIVGVDTTTLETLLDHAEALQASTTAGADIGQYPQQAKDALAELIDSARAVIADDAGQRRVDDESRQLRQGIRTFEESVVIAEVVTVNDDDPTIAYTGAWNHLQNRSPDYNQDIHVSTQDGASAQFTFTGPQVEIIGPKTPNNGRAEVYLDGALVDTIQPVAETYLAQQVIFTAAELGPGQHTVTITKADGTYLQLDAFRHYAPATSPGSGT